MDGDLDGHINCGPLYVYIQYAVGVIKWWPAGHMWPVEKLNLVHKMYICIFFKLHFFIDS